LRYMYITLFFLLNIALTQNTYLNCILILFNCVSKVTYAVLVSLEVQVKQIFMLFFSFLFFICILI
jgi:hypothetical protein